MSKIVTSKSEDELIATVENIVDAERCLLFAQRAMRSNMPALAAVCEARAKLLKPPRAGKATLRSAHARQLKTHSVAEQALEFLVEDYKAALSPTSYGKLVERCGFNARNNARWFGQVTGLIDAACALAGVPSFALARVREDNGEINHAAWKTGPFIHLRDRVIASALAGAWNDDDFAKIRDALAAAHRLSNKLAWDYVFERVDMSAWADKR